MKLLLVVFSLTPLWLSATALADATTGKQVFDQKKCNGCHYTAGPAREKTIEDQLAKKGPELWYAGSKFQRPWLEKWLQEPTPIRLLKYNSLTDKNPNDHIRLDSADSTQITDFLMSLTSDIVASGVIKPKMNPKGRLIFKKRMPCSGCHQYVDRKKVLGGLTGPSLVGAGERLNPDWIYAYLKETKVFKPVRMMPTFQGLLSEKDMASVAAFVASF